MASPIQIPSGMNDALWPLRTNVVSANAARPRGAGSATGQNADDSRSVVTAMGATSLVPLLAVALHQVRLHSDSLRRPTQTRDPFARSSATCDRAESDRRSGSDGLRAANDTTSKSGSDRPDVVLHFVRHGAGRRARTTAE